MYHIIRDVSKYSTHIDTIKIYKRLVKLCKYCLSITYIRGVVILVYATLAYTQNNTMRIIVWLIKKKT